MPRSPHDQAMMTIQKFLAPVSAVRCIAAWRAVLRVTTRGLRGDRIVS